MKNYVLFLLHWTAGWVFLDSGQIIKQLVWCNVYLMGGLRKCLPPNSLIRPRFCEQSVQTVKTLAHWAYFHLQRCVCVQSSTVLSRPCVHSALCNYDWLLIKEACKALIPTLNAAQHPSGCLSDSLLQAENAERESRIITDSKQNLTVLRAASLGLFLSPDNDTNIVTPFYLGLDGCVMQSASVSCQQNLI